MNRNAARTLTALACGVILSLTGTVAHTATDGGQFAPNADISTGRIAYAAPAGE